MTRSGIGALVFGALVTLAGWRLAWAPFLVLGIGCLLLVGVGVSYLIRRPRLTIERQIQPSRVSKGSLAIAYLDIHNTSRLSSPATLAVQDLGPVPVRTVLPKLVAGERTVKTVKLPTTRRGIFTVGPIEIRRSDPFGFVKHTQQLAEPEEIWVYPQVLGFHPLPTGLTRPLEGPTSDTAPQGNITFHRLREYVVGDDLRMIHWKSTARTGQLMVRHNIDTSQPYTVVLSDLRPEVHSAGSFELSLDAAASAVASASGGNAPVQLRTTSGASIGGPNRRHIQPIFDFLTTVEPDDAGSLQAQLIDIRRSGGGTALVVVTGTLSDEDFSLVGGMGHLFQRVVVVAVGTAGVGVHIPAATGVAVVSGSDADSLVGSWNVAVTR